MSRAPQSNRQQQHYSYAIPHEHAFYYEEGEGYIGDYSESDALSDSAPTPVHVIQRNPDVTELYRRKNGAVSPSREIYHQNVYVPTEYYYETPPAQLRVAPVVAPQTNRKRIVIHPQNRYYVNDDATIYHQQLQQQQQQPQQQPPQANMVYQHSLPQIATVPRSTVVPTIPSASRIRSGQPQIVRRHPVTVRTPRYVRRPSTLYKKPSTLCLPIACQPDPASYRRVRRIAPGDMQTSELYSTPSRVIPRRHSLSAPIHASTSLPKPKKSESRKSLDLTKSRLDAILERYEKIFGKTPDSKLPEVGGDTELLKHLKPRIPPCLKEKLNSKRQQNAQNITKQQIPEIIKTAETFEVEEISSEVLEELLTELTEHGFNDVIDENIRKKIVDNACSKSIKSSKSSSEQTPDADSLEHLAPIAPPLKVPQVEIPVKDPPKSFNYEEIKSSLSKTSNSGTAKKTTSTETRDVEVSKRIDRAIGTPHDIKTIRSPQISLDDAMELHRTKSYVVNLIDTALSNHFGTNASEKNSNKETVDAKNAVEMLKKHSSGKMDKDLCLEIAQALTDSFVSSSSVQTSSNKSSECSCKAHIDEPTFVKQLKQMRWGHLKHIQREVRRLEDLERFLDSCSGSTYDKCHTHQ